MTRKPMRLKRRLQLINRDIRAIRKEQQRCQMLVVQSALLTATNVRLIGENDALRARNAKLKSYINILYTRHAVTGTMPDDLSDQEIVHVRANGTDH